MRGDFRVSALAAIDLGYQPTRMALYRDPELSAAQPFITGLCEIFRSAKPRSAFPPRRSWSFSFPGTSFSSR
jgi:hypothetical protein